MVFLILHIFDIFPKKKKVFRGWAGIILSLGLEFPGGKGWQEARGNIKMS